MSPISINVLTADDVYRLWAGIFFLYNLIHVLVFSQSNSLNVIEHQSVNPRHSLNPIGHHWNSVGLKKPGKGWHSLMLTGPKWGVFLVQWYNTISKNINLHQYWVDIHLPLSPVRPTWPSSLLTLSRRWVWRTIGTNPLVLTSGCWAGASIFYILHSTLILPSYWRGE